MSKPPSGPGAVLVVLRRHDTATDVLLLAGEGEGDAPLPWAAAAGEETQRSVLQDLIREHGDGVDRVYASPIQVPGKQGPLGVFVAFAEGPVAAAPEAEWRDLRRACLSLPPIWCAALSTVRQRFVAKPPDEALRIL